MEGSTTDEAESGAYIAKLPHNQRSGAGKIQRRLEALGILEGTKVVVLNRKRNGSTIIKVRGTRWALGNEIAEGIEVEELKG